MNRDNDDEIRRAYDVHRRAVSNPLWLDGWEEDKEERPLKDNP